MTAIGHLLAIEFGDDIALFEAGPAGGRCGSDTADQSATLIRQVESFAQRGSDWLDVNAQVAAHDPAFVVNAIHHIPRHVDRHCKSDSHTAAGAAQNKG